MCNNSKRVEYTENSLVVNEDPGFVSEKDQNFKLKSSSEVFIKIPGFKPIPFEEMGLLKTEDNSSTGNQSNIK